jgi:DNA-binding NtrC family response regulator
MVLPSNLLSTERLLMSGEVTALLIFHQTKPFNEMEAALEKLAIPTRRAQTLAEASHALSKVNPPLLAFTESELPDGNWSDVVSLSETASSRVSVIVVGQEIDAKLYASAIEVGAFDYIAPPFEAGDLAHVVRCAVDNALARRERAKNSRPTAGQLLPIAVKSQGSA